MLVRTILTGLVFIGYGAINAVHRTVSPLISGPVAAGQLLDGAAATEAYIETSVVSSMFNGSGISLLILLAAIAAIWYKPIIDIFKTKEV